MRNLLLYIVLLVFTLSFSSCSDFDGSEDDDDYELYDYKDNANYLSSSGVNKWMFEQMASSTFHYYWNPNYTESFVNSLDFTASASDFYSSLLHVPSSTLGSSEAHDGTIYNGTHYPYSTMWNEYSAKSAGDYTTYSTGIDFDIYSYNGNNIFFSINYVEPGSSADLAGVTRDYCITAIGGNELTYSNYSVYAYELYYGNTGTQYDLTLYKIRDEADQDTEQYCYYTYNTRIYTIYKKDKLDARVTMQETTINPVLASTIIDLDDKKVGYIAYTQFTDNSMCFYNVFSEFKSSGITDLVVDLRYNGGGYVSTSSNFSACLAGSAYNDKVCCYLRDINNDLMLGGTYTLSSNDYQLNVNTIYFLVGSDTASASEIVINCMKGLGKTCYLIGEQTEGKNVASHEIESSTTYSGYKYYLQPITCKVTNNLGSSSYANGFTPDIETFDFFSIDRYELGDENEYFLKIALMLINSSSSSSASKSIVPTSIKPDKIKTQKNKLQGAIARQDD